MYPATGDGDKPSLTDRTSDISDVSPKDASAVDRGALPRYLFSLVDTKWTDIPLIVCGFISGLIDGLSFNVWGSFANMQTDVGHTGNMIFVALGVAGKPDHPPLLWEKALIAVGAFFVGTVFFVYGSRWMGPLHRATLITSSGIQTIFLLAAALLVHHGAVRASTNHGAPIEWSQILTIALISFQAAGQVVASRFLAFAEIPTVVLTTLVCDLFLDPKVYQRPWSANPKRNRRLGAFLALVLGAMTAGGMAKQTGLAGGLWLAMALKASITVTWMIWPARVSEEKDDVSVVAFV